MDCGKFQDLISDYLEGALDARLRTECGAHRLRCSECREIYNDVRGAMNALSGLATEPMPAPVALEDRILAATTTGVMLNCDEFDRLLERYFDGVILAPTFQTFQSHFEQCRKCRRLLGSIEDAIELCHEVKQDEVEVPRQLCDRIVAATSGTGSRWHFRSILERVAAKGRFLSSRAVSRQWATAAIIFLAAFTLTTLRFGSVSGLAAHAEAKAERMVHESHVAINETGVLALASFQMVSKEVSTLLRGSGRGSSTSGSRSVEGQPSPSPPPAATTDRREARDNSKRKASQ
jgi:predicted anti-sigma-YlaC factor YlaD